MVSSLVPCVYRCIETLFKFAWWWRSFNQGNAEAVLNAIGGGGQRKRDAYGQTDWGAHWHALTVDQQANVRSQLPPTPGFWMHSVGKGSPDIPDSVAFHYAPDGTNSTLFRHVTNGTHGFVHNMQPSADTTPRHKRAFITQPNHHFTFGDDVAGIKLSYIHPCKLPSYGPWPESKADDLIQQFTESFEQGGADKFAIEMTEKHDPIIYGTLVIEQSGFGDDFEGIDFTPPNTICRDEL